jgi:hypothetical protein
LATRRFAIWMVSSSGLAIQYGPVREPPETWVYFAYPTGQRDPQALTRFSFNSMHGVDGRSWTIGFPHWTACLLFALIPSAWMWRAMGRRRSVGLCPACGYDLRGTPESKACPEGGAPSV